MKSVRMLTALLLCSVIALPGRATYYEPETKRVLTEEQAKTQQQAEATVKDRAYREFLKHPTVNYIDGRLGNDSDLMTVATTARDGELSPAGAWVKEHVHFDRPIVSQEANLYGKILLDDVLGAPERMNMAKDVKGGGLVLRIESPSVNRGVVFRDFKEFVGFTDDLISQGKKVPDLADAPRAGAGISALEAKPDVGLLEYKNKPAGLLEYKGKYSRESLQSLRSFSDDVGAVAEKYGLTMEEFYRLAPERAETLTVRQRARLIAIRESVPRPTTDTLLEKVIPQADIQKYLNGEFDTVQGFFNRAQDTKGVKNPFDTYWSMRLDYEPKLGRSPAFDPYNDQSIGVIRFKTVKTDKIAIPFNDSMGGIETASYPNTGNGFTAAENGRVIPEFKFTENKISVQDGAELFEVTKDGREILRGVFIDGAFRSAGGK